MNPATICPHLTFSQPDIRADAHCAECGVSWRIALSEARVSLKLRDKVIERKNDALSQCYVALSAVNQTARLGVGEELPVKVDHAAVESAQRLREQRDKARGTVRRLRNQVTALLDEYTSTVEPGGETTVEPGPEHQCGGPDEACALPGCWECGMTVGAVPITLARKDQAFVAYRCFTGWCIVRDALAAANMKLTRLKSTLSVVRHERDRYVKRDAEAVRELRALLDKKISEAPIILTQDIEVLRQHVTEDIEVLRQHVTDYVAGKPVDDSARQEVLDILACATIIVDRVALVDLFDRLISEYDGDDHETPSEAAYALMQAQRQVQALMMNIIPDGGPRGVSDAD